MNADGEHRSFARSVAVLASGTAGGQAIAVLASPFLSRLYTPDEFGTFGVYLALVSIAAVAVSLRYEAALPLPESEDEAVGVLVLTFVVTVVMTILAGLVMWLVVDHVTVPPDFRGLLWLMPLGLFLTGLQRRPLDLLGDPPAGLRGQRSVEHRPGCDPSRHPAGPGTPRRGVRGDGGRLRGRPGERRRQARLHDRSGAVAAGAPRVVGRLRAAALRYRQFPLFALWSSLLSIISQQAPILILAAIFDATVVGWFSITVRVLLLPSAIVGNAVGQVFYARVSRSDLEDITRTSATLYRSLVTLGAGPMWLLAIGGEYAFGLVFGDAWREAGQYAQWLAPWLLLEFVTSPLSPLAYVRDKQPGLVAFQGALLGVRVGALFVGAALGGAKLAIALYGLSSAGLLGAYLVWLLRIGGVGTRRPMRVLARELVVGAMLAAPLLAASIVAAPQIAWLCVAVACLGVMVARAGRLIGRLAPPGGPVASSSQGAFAG